MHENHCVLGGNQEHETADWLAFLGLTGSGGLRLWLAAGRFHLAAFPGQTRSLNGPVFTGLFAIVLAPGAFDWSELRCS